MTQAQKQLYTVLVPVTVLLWGTEYTLIAYIVDYIPPIWMVASRTLIAAIILATIVYVKGHRLPPLKDKSWIWYGLMGVVGMTAPFYLIASGEVHIDSGLTAILIGVTPLITVILAHLFVKSEPLTPLKMLGFLVGFLGIILLFMPEKLGLALVENWQAQTLILLAAVGYATASILGKRAPEQPTSVGATIMLITATITACIGAAFTGLPEVIPPAKPIVALLALAFGATALGNLLYLRIIQLSGPSLIAKINYMVPVFSLTAGMLFLDEPFSGRAMIALLIIIIGLIIARAGEKKIPKTGEADVR